MTTSTTTTHRPAIWTCMVVHRDLDRDDLSLFPPGCDLPMRQAAEAAFERICGHAPEGVSSGWGQTYIPEADAAALDGRNVDESHHAAWVEAREIVAHAVGDDDPGDDFTARRQRWDAAVSALTELLYDRGRESPS